MKRSFSYYGAKAWNHLPPELKNLEINDIVFKTNLKEYIQENIDFFSDMHVV